MMPPTARVYGPLIARQTLFVSRHKNPKITHMCNFNSDVDNMKNFVIQTKDSQFGEKEKRV